VLGGRYAVQRRLEQLARAERWSAHDTTLDRDVVVVCFDETESHADATLDAARRAAGVDNARLVRVLDVGRSEGIAFFVEELLPDAHSLAQVLEQGGLPAEEARRIAGEAATGLEAARARGLHHLRLTPHAVLRAHDGTVKVRGLATAAAMAEVEDVEPDVAARLDAVGVVAIAYAALTSRWPLPGGGAGLEAAPHVVGGVPAPSEIAAGVPGDLDALCRLTLNEDQGPLTPGDFASQIAPWATSQVAGFAAPRRTDDTNPTVALPLADLPWATDHGTQPAGSPSDGPVGAGPEPTQTLPAPVPSAHPAAPQDHADTPTAPLRVEPGAEAPVGAEAVGTPPTGTSAGEADAGPVHGASGAGAAAAAGAVGAALGTAGSAAGHAATGAAHKVGSFARAAADKAAERRAQRQAAQERAERRRISLDDALVETAEPLDPPLPLLPQELAAPATRDQSKLVLAIIAAFLVVATFFAVWGITRIGANTDLGLGGTPTPRGTVTVTAPTTTVTPGETSTTSTGDTAGEPYPILGATGYDPEGDNSERNGEAPRVYDGRTSTFWSSEGYASANLGGLKKGVGVRLDLGQVRAVHSVQIVLPDASDVEVDVGPDRNRDSATALGTSSGKAGAITLTKDGAPVQAQYVFVWFTKVSQVSDGRFRATLAEVVVR
jgi:hypothetical protein